MKEAEMGTAEVPGYAIFEDYRSSQRIAVAVRWFVLLTWLLLINVRSDETHLAILNAMGGAIFLLNAYLQWRILRGVPITWPYVLLLSVMDLSIITAGLMITSGFENTRFVFYYPALLGVALIFRRRISFAIVTVVAGVYVAMSVVMDSGVDTSFLFNGDQKVLLVRVVSMFAVVVVGNLMTRIERERRRQALAAERARMEENTRLQRRAEEAERRVQSERIRISHEIHDGAAQSAYVLSLGLETSRQLAGDNLALRDRLGALHAQSKQALWELRYPINLGPLFEGRSLPQILNDHVDNFRAITSIPTTFSARGPERSLPAVTKQRVFSVAHNALTNIYRYAQASNVMVDLAYDTEALKLSVSDDGVGLNTAEVAASSGHGLRNMRQVGEELGGTLDISSSPEEGTTIILSLPLKEVPAEYLEADDR